MSLVSALDQARWSRQAYRQWRRAAGSAAAVAGLLLIAGCHVPFTSSSAASGPTASGTVTVAAAPGLADAPLYIGIKDGYFSRAGLTVRVDPTSSVVSGLAALHSGRANVVFGDYADMFYAQEQRKAAPQLRAVADGYDAAPNVIEVLTLPRSGITGPADLRGQRVGTAMNQEKPVTSTQPTPLPYSLDTVAAWSVLAGNNIDPSSVHWVPMQSGNLIGALAHHQVDAILATEPTIYAAETQLGAVPVLDAATGATANLPVAGYFTNSAYASQHGDVVRAFRAALEQAQAQGGMAGPVQAALTKGAGLPAKTAALVTVGQYPTTLSALNLQRVANLMFSFNALPSALTVSSIVAK
jgi:NitT/TauT family transport system substrate-binding protein